MQCICLQNCLLPSQALKVILTVMAHQPGQEMSEDEIRTLCETAEGHLSAPWPRFSTLREQIREGWATLVPASHTFEESPLELQFIMHGHRVGSDRPVLPPATAYTYEETLACTPFPSARDEV